MAAQVDSSSVKSNEKKPTAVDTLFTKSNEKIPGKVLEIGVSEIKYKKASFLDGPTFIIEKSKVVYIVFASGIKDVIQQEQQEPSVTVVYPSGMVATSSSSSSAPIGTLDKNKAVKIEPFSPITGRIIFGYEQSIRVGLNLEGKVGYINSNYMKNDFYGSSYYYYRNSAIAGGFFKGGIKFTFGQDYQRKGDWYKHPLKGHYLRVNALVTKFKITYDNGYYYNANGTTSPYPNTDLSISAYGIMGDYGYQFVIGNLITLDMYVGLGYVAYNQASNIQQGGTPNIYYNSAYYYTSPNYYSHTSFSSYRNSAGVAFNTGMTLGVAFK